jgi:uncharacterized protein
MVLVRTINDSRLTGVKMTKDEILEFLKNNKELLKSRYRVKRIGLFGSYARGENNSDSDIDIIVDMPSTFDDFFELKEFLEKGLGVKIDLGLEKTLRQLIKSRIQNEIIYV